MATHVTDKDFEDKVLKSKIPVLVDFYADWCGPCKAMAPIIEEAAKTYKGKVNVFKLDVDKSPDSAQKYGVMSIPTLVYFKGGKEVDRSSGALPKEALAERLDGLA